TQEYRYRYDRDSQMLEVPYKGKRLSMLILLPAKGGTLASLETKLTPYNLARWLEDMTSRKVILTLPKFKLTAEFELKKTLSAMGMPTPFDMNRADFPGINGRKDLYIYEVVHKAFVDVNELGTEAAAATAVVIREKSLPPRISVDRPFLFLL